MSSGLYSLPTVRSKHSSASGSSLIRGGSHVGNEAGPTAKAVNHRNHVPCEPLVQAGIRGSQLFAILKQRCEFLLVVWRHGFEHQPVGSADATIGVAVGKPYVCRSRGSLRSAEAWAIVVPNASRYPQRSNSHSTRHSHQSSRALLASVESRGDSAHSDVRRFDSSPLWKPSR